MPKRVTKMPIISTFYGISIKMYFRQGEHNPPHFHAYYGSYASAFDIRTLKMIDGSLPPKAKLLVMEWAVMHQDKLMEIWETQNFEKVEPLE